MAGLMPGLRIYGKIGGICPVQGFALESGILTYSSVDVGGGSNFFKVGFFGRWVFAIFLKSFFLQGGCLQFFKGGFL